MNCKKDCFTLTVILLPKAVHEKDLLVSMSVGVVRQTDVAPGAVRVPPAPAARVRGGVDRQAGVVEAVRGAFEVGGRDDLE